MIDVERLDEIGRASHGRYVEAVELDLACVVATHNGFKLTLAKKPFFARDILRLGDIAARGNFPQGAGRSSERAVLDGYVERLLKDYDGRKPLFVAWDAGNGAAGEAMQRLTAKLPGRHLLLNETIDGRFPAHHPDPTETKNLVQLQEAVRREGCDLGIAFDGDADRIGVVDGQGRILWGDQFMVLLARDVLRAKPGATIIADVKATQVLFDEVARMGGDQLPWALGKLYFSKNGKLKSVDLTRANPMLNAVTQTKVAEQGLIRGGLASAIGVLPPAFGAALDVAFAKSAYKGRPLKVEGETTERPNKQGDRITDLQAIEIYGKEMLDLAAPYRTAENVAAHGRPISDNSLLFRQRYTQYKDPQRRLRDLSDVHFDIPSSRARRALPAAVAAVACCVHRTRRTCSSRAPRRATKLGSRF